MNYTIPKQLLSKGSTNTKTAKNPIDTHILYLAPYNQNSLGINICPKASKGCAAACLFTAGRGRFSNVKAARINRTEYYLQDKERFILQIASELVKINKKGKALIRLNGTSDIDFISLLKKYAKLDVFTLNNLIFYDYTKIMGKVRKYADTSYVQTFSRAEDNENEMMQALHLGVNVSVVFNGEIPKTYRGFTVVDGDITDVEMISYKGVILALKAKGDAKKDKTGFVVSVC